MILILVATLIIPLFATLFLFKKQRNSSLPPGPPGLPYVGNFFQFDPLTPHIYLWKLSQKYGPIIYMKLGKVPLIVVSTPKLAKEVLKTQDLAFCGRPRGYGQYAMSYNGLDIAFMTYNDSWRELRKICVLQLLSNKQVMSFRPVRQEEVSHVSKKIHSKAISGQTVDLSNTMMSFTATLICRVAFGKKYDEEGSEKRRFHRLMIETQAMLAGPFFADYLPLFSWVDKVSGMLSRLDRIYKDMDEFFQELIDEHLDSKRPKPVNPNLLDLLIQLKNEKSCPIDLTWDHVKAVIMDMLVAGTDTSAATLIWGMTALIKNPNIMKKLQKETREIIGTKGQITEEDISKLPYLKAVVKETLRLFPPAPLLLPRETLDDTVLDGYKIPAKTMVYVNAWAVARDPDTWENPNEFMPERFLNSNIDIIGQDIEVIPFGAGRRGCPGITMGLGTVEFMLANLVYSFDWELPAGMNKEDVDMEVLPGITMHKKNPLCLVPKPYFK